MKATEQGSEDAAKIVLNAEDIRIIPKDETYSSNEGERVKQLGEFEIEIYPKEAQPIRRLIGVLEEKG